MTPSYSHADWFRSRLVVLSDRRPAPGAARTGLEAGIEWALREHDGVWLGQHAGSEPGSAEGDAAASELERWSVLEGDSTSSSAALDGWASYVRANAAYAERIVESVSPDGTVWLNGHRWLLVASALRELGHRGPVGLLLDVPFPSRARLEPLPWYADVMSSLCQLDLLGLRTPACADNFEACRVHTGQRRPWIGVFPDGIAAVTHADPSEWVTSFLQLLVRAASRAAQNEILE